MTPPVRDIAPDRDRSDRALPGGESAPSGRPRRPACGSLIDRATGRVVVHWLAIADRFWPRLVGLQFRRSLPAGQGLLLVPCASVHTFWLRFPLDLAMLGDGGLVLAVHRSVRPWRAAIAPRGTRAVLEVTGGTLDLAAGDRISLAAADPPPPSVRFLSNEPKVGSPE